MKTRDYSDRPTRETPIALVYSALTDSYYYATEATCGTHAPRLTEHHTIAAHRAGLAETQELTAIE